MRSSLIKQTCSVNFFKCYIAIKIFLCKGLYVGHSLSQQGVRVSFGHQTLKLLPSGHPKYLLVFF